MDLSGHYKMLARYNRIANERLYACCAQLDDAERRKQRPGSFGSIHALLNHILLGDRIWMGRFENPGHSRTPPLNTVLYDDFAALREARVAEDARIEKFFIEAGPEFFTQELRYTNSMGVDYVDQAAVASAHLFNHQTHHRGQIHVMLSQTPVKPPSLDVHRIVNP
jgi:uncharacterized damage-inducible protein DinB